MENFNGKSANQNNILQNDGNTVGRIISRLEDNFRPQTINSDTLNNPYITQNSEDKNKTVKEKCDIISVEYAFRIMAKNWNQIQFNVEQFKDKSQQTFDLSLENLKTLADELSLEFELNSKKIKQLKPEDFPCLIILNDSDSVIATKRIGKKQLEITDGDILDTVTIKNLEKQSSGNIITFRPKIAALETEAAMAEKSEKYNVFGAVINNILSEHKSLLTQMVLVATISNLMIVVLPLFIMSIYDRIVPHLAFETLWVLSFGVLIALGIDLCMKLLRQNLTDAISLATSVKLQTKLFRHLSRLKFKDVPENAGGLSHSTSEFDNISQLVPQILVGLFVDLPFFVIIMALLYHLGNAVILAPIVGVIVIFMIHITTYFLSRKKAAKSTQLTQKKSNHIIETIGLYENIKATAIEDKRLSIWERLADKAAFAGHQERKFNFFSTHSSVIISQVVIVFTLIIGVYQLKEGLITVGGLAASSLLVGRAIAPMTALFGLIVKAYQYRKTSAVIEDVFNAPLELAGDLSKISTSKIKGDIEFSNVSFAYNQDDGNVLENINIKIKHGEKVGIVGKVGCGKSTLMRLAVRYYEADTGRMMLDGHDIKQYSPSNMRKSLAYMSQNYNLFNDTLHQNLCSGIDNLDEALFAKVVQFTGVHEFAAEHGQGYSMSVGANGERLSGGQKQSVALTKCILRQPKVYMLDEPTSAMDNHLENVVVRNLSKFIGDNTLIVATHRAPILNLVDRIIWLDKGKLILDGPKDEVLSAIKTGQMPNENDRKKQAAKAS